MGLSIATSDKNDKYLYDVSRIEKAGQAGKLSHIPARDNLATYKDEVNRLREKNKNPGPFALRVPVEETRDLIAVHNATEKNVRGLLGLGGLPMPSIAIIKAAQGHDNFGEYSFVFDKSTIDPATNRNNKVYGSDAFTPVAPHIEYEVKDDKAYKEFQSEISNLNKKMPATNHTLMYIHNYNYFNTLLSYTMGRK